MSKFAQRMFDVLAHQKTKPHFSNDHLSVSGTLIQVWASLKSFKDGSDTPPSPGRNGALDFHGHKLANDTHECTTDLDTKLYRKRSNATAKRHRDFRLALGAARSLGRIRLDDQAA